MATPDRPQAEGAERARALRFEYGLGDAPLRDVFSLIERRFPAVLVIRRPMATGPQGVLLRDGPRHVIIVNTTNRCLADQRLTAAHELGHLLFDADRAGVQIDDDLNAGGSAGELRAQSFAVNFLLPAEVLLGRARESRALADDTRALGSLALEYGIDAPSLALHMKQTFGLGEAERDRIAAVDLRRIGVEQGLLDEVRHEHTARGSVSFPSRYIALLAEAIRRGSIDHDSVVAHLDGDATTAAEMLETIRG